MDLSKFTDADLNALEAGDIKKLSDAGLDELERQQTPKSVAEQNLASMNGKGPIDELMDMGKAAWEGVKKAGTETKAGYAGIADLIAGNGLNQAVQGVKNVEEDKPATSAAAVYGEALGGQFTPVQIALQAVGGKIAEALGPIATRVMQGWSEAAARAAIGWTKKIAEAIGIEDFAAVGRFLLEPITFGGKTFAPIVTAGSSAEAMLAKATAIRNAAGKQLESVAVAGDKAISEAGKDGGVSFMSDLPALRQKLVDLRNSISDYTPNMGKAATNQYDNAIADIDLLIEKVKAGNTDGVFSTLSKIKTTIGELVFKHGSPLESKAAYNDVYHAVSKTLADTAKNVGGPTSEAYAAANAIYNKAATVMEALEGKVLTGSSARSFFNDPAALVAGITSGASTANPVIGAATFLGTKAAENYGPQAVAAGLNKATPLVAPGLEVTARGVPVVARGFMDAINPREQE